RGIRGNSAKKKKIKTKRIVRREDAPCECARRVGRTNFSPSRLLPVVLIVRGDLPPKSSEHSVSAATQHQAHKNGSKNPRASIEPARSLQGRSLGYVISNAATTRRSSLTNTL